MALIHLTFSEHAYARYKELHSVLIEHILQWFKTWDSLTQNHYQICSMCKRIRRNSLLRKLNMIQMASNSHYSRL